MAREELSHLLDSEVSDLVYLSAGQIGDIYQARFHGELVVIKTTAEEREDLLIEARMLQDLREEGMRVPQVIASAREALVLEYIEPCNNPGYEREREAAKALAALHRVSNDSRMYGYYYNTPIASFTQNNEQTQYNWGLFLSQMRILPMAKYCYERGVLERSLLERLEVLCSGLYRRIDMSRITPSLLHGDLWSGNLLYEKNGPCFIDPAIYFGDREMELAFILLFHTFGERFFDEYTTVHPLSEDFYETKAALYQIYPLLVHIALYGGGYVGGLKQRLEQLKV